MANVISIFRDAPWLCMERASAWARISAVISTLAALTLVFVTHGGFVPDPWGRPLGTDFSSFWTAARLASDGIPEAAWDPVAHAAAEQASFGLNAGYANDYYAFFYPPPFLLICLPLAFLPYNAGLAIWLAATGLACLFIIKTLLPRQWPATLTFFAFPAVSLNAEHGQNGALSVALIGAAALQLDRRPRTAGVCLGALCFKPQLALLVVPALVIARRWRSLTWAVGTAGMMFLGSLLVLGEAAWRSFLASAPLAKVTLELGLVGFGKMASPFAAMSLLGAAPSMAWAAQSVVSIVALFTVLSVSRRRPGAAAEGATIAAAACLATPFLLDYDLMLLAVPLAWVAARAECGGYLPWEKLTLAAAFVLPMVTRPLAMKAGVPLAPLVITALLVTVVRRARLAPAVPVCST